jgi:hypothetical protein
MKTSNQTKLLPLWGTVLKSVTLSDHITIGFLSLLRIFGTITWCCHCNCVLLCLQTQGGSIITTCELIHYHYCLCCFTRTLYVSGITCCNYMQVCPSFTIFLHCSFTQHPHTRIQTRNTRHHILTDGYTAHWITTYAYGTCRQQRLLVRNFIK